MVQVPDEEYKKLKHDADDNRSIKFLAKCIIGIIVALTLYFSIGIRILNVWVEYYKDSIECDIRTMKAKNAVLIREIQSKNMEMDDYLKWYEIYSETN